MTFKEACRALGLSRSSFQRRIRSGAVKATKLGEGQFAPLTFDPADLGLPVTEPETGPLAGDLRADLPNGDPVVRTEMAPLPISDHSDSVADATEEELIRRVALGCRPDDPNGTPSNAPCLGSSTMPSMENFIRANQARAELQKRELAGRTPVPQRRRRVFYGYRDEALAKHNSMVANLGKVD